MSKSPNKSKITKKFFNIQVHPGQTLICHLYICKAIWKSAVLNMKKLHITYIVRAN